MNLALIAAAAARAAANKPTAPEALEMTIEHGCAPLSHGTVCPAPAAMLSSILTYLRGPLQAHVDPQWCRAVRDPPQPAEDLRVFVREEQCRMERSEDGTTLMRCQERRRVLLQG